MAAGLGGRLSSMGATAPLGALAGGALGAGISGYRGYSEARDAGYETGASLAHGLGGAFRGGLRGAGVGAVGGSAVGALRPGSATALTSLPGALGAFARSGVRQVHGVAGHLNPSELRAVRGGDVAAREAYQAALAERDALRAPTAKALQAVDRAKSRYDVERKMTDAGLMSLRGMGEALVGSPSRRAEALSLIPKHSVTGMSPAMLAMSFGLPAAEGVNALRKPEQPGGPGRAEAVGRTVGGLTGGVIGGPLPFASNFIAGNLGAAVGGRVGRLVDRLRGHRSAIASPTAPLDPTDGGRSAPVERVMSPSAAGRAPEGV